MATKGLKVWEFDPKIYPRKLFVVKGTKDPNCLKGVFTDRNGDDLDEADLKYADATTYREVILCKTGMFGTLVVLWPQEVKRNEGQVAHEAVHVANSIFREIGVDMDYCHDEHYAYFVQWITNCIMEVNKSSKD